MKAFVKSSHSFTRTHTRTHARTRTLSLSLTHSRPCLGECPRRWKWDVREGRGFHKAHKRTSNEAKGKTCPSDVSDRAPGGTDRVGSDLTLLCDLSSPLLTGTIAPPCAVDMAASVCVHVWPGLAGPGQAPAEQECGHLSRHRPPGVLLMCQNVVC